MLTSSRLSNDALLAHLLRQENLSQSIVDFVCTRVVQILTLQVQLASIFLTHALGVIEWGRTSHIIL